MTEFYVAPKGTWWTITKNGEEFGLFSHRDQATALAREWAAKMQGSSVVVLDPNGREVQREKGPWRIL